MMQIRKVRCVLGVVVAAGCVCAGGCQEQIFSADEPRSQYDRVDVVRDNRKPAQVEDEYGTKRINLRGRLLTGE